VGRHRWFIYYLDLAAVFAAVTSINAVFLAVPRELSAQAEDGLLPKWIMNFNPRRQTFPFGMAAVAVAGCLLVTTNLPVGIYGLLCVFGLILANVFFSLGIFRLFKLYPDKVANAPFPVKKWWAYPSAVISALTSLAFALLSLFFLATELGKIFKN
jgi:amino acid transporter